MITFHSSADGSFIVRGESVDTKPINAVPGNSIFEELDTGKEYSYREVDKKWLPKGDSVGQSKIAYQPDSTATTIAALKDDFNALLAGLSAAGLMEAGEDNS